MTDAYDPNAPPDNEVEVEPALPNEMPEAPAPAPAPVPQGARVRSPRAPAPQGTGAQAPIPEKGKGGRPKGKTGEVPETQWSTRDIDVLWPEVIAWLGTKGLGPHDVKINVIQTSPPPRIQVGTSFEGQTAAGTQSETPTDAIMRIVTDYYHLPVAHGPADYELQIVWRANGHYVANGQLRLGNPQEVITLRNAAMARRAQVGQPGYQPPAPGLGVPPMQPAPYVPPYVPPFAAPPVAPPAARASESESDEIKMLKAEIARMKESEEMRQLREENARLRQGYTQPGFGQRPQAPVAAPITAESLAAAITAALPAALKAAGVGAAPAAAAGAREEPDSISAMRKGLELLREFKKFGNEAQDMFDPGDPEPQPTTAAEPPKPEGDEMPYDIWEVGSKWGDGSPAKLVRDKETGGIDLLGLALANPYPSQKLMDAAAKFMERFGQSRGVAGAPEEEPEQLQQQHHEPAADPPAPNGQSEEPGWDNLS